MDGLFELLIIAVFILAPMIDAWKRRSKQGGEEAGEGPPVDIGESGSGDRSGTRASSTTSRRTRDGATSADRDRSAEELVPSDLWAILTGQQPESSAELPDVYRRSESQQEPREESEPWSEWESAEPASYDDSAEEPTGPHPWEYEEEATDRGVPGTMDGHSWTEVGQRGEIGSGEGPDRRDELEELGGLIAGRSLQRAGRSLDRAARLGGGMGGAPGVTGGARGTGSLGSGLADAGSGAHRFFHDLDRDELRRAIVLNEVLGPPLALKGE